MTQEIRRLARKFGEEYKEVSERLNDLADFADERKLAPKEFTTTSIDALNLSARAYIGLRKSNITTVEGLMSISDVELSKIRGLGTKSIAEIQEKLGKFQNGKPIPLPDVKLHYSLYNLIAKVNACSSQLEDDVLIEDLHSWKEASNTPKAWIDLMQQLTSTERLLVIKALGKSYRRKWNTVGELRKQTVEELMKPIGLSPSSPRLKGEKTANFLVEAFKRP